METISDLIKSSLISEAAGTGYWAARLDDTRKAQAAEEQRRSTLRGRAESAYNTAKGKLSAGYNAAKAHVQRNRGAYGLGAGAAAATGLTLGAIAAKKGLDNRNSLRGRLNRAANQAQKFGKKHGGKIAGGAAAALGAAVGTKALLKYLRNKKKKSR